MLELLTVACSSSLSLTLSVASPSIPRCVLVQMANCMTPYPGQLGELEKWIKLPGARPLGTHKTGLTRELSFVTTTDSGTTPQICHSKIISHGWERNPPSRPVHLGLFTPWKNELLIHTLVFHRTEIRKPLAPFVQEPAKTWFGGFHLGKTRLTKQKTIKNEKCI